MCCVYQTTVKFAPDCCTQGTAFAKACFILYWLGERDLVSYCQGKLDAARIDGVVWRIRKGSVR